MNATNRKAIKILKSKMTLEERKALVSNAKLDYNTVNSIYDLLVWSFNWVASEQGVPYWVNIYKRFTNKELEQKIDIK